MANEVYNFQTPDGVNHEVQDTAARQAAASKYTKPSTGIPKSDLSQSVQDTLDEVANKVDKVTGKGLSSNDYTDADKAKVDGAIQGIQDSEGNTLPKENGVVTLPEMGGGEGTVTGVKIGGTTYEPTEGVVDVSAGIPDVSGKLSQSDVSVMTQGDGTVDINVGSDTYSINLNHTHPDKQDTLKDSTTPLSLGERTNFKTVNGQSLLGGGDLSVAQTTYLKVTFDANSNNEPSFTDIDDNALTHAQVRALFNDPSKNIVLHDTDYDVLFRLRVLGYEDYWDFEFSNTWDYFFMSLLWDNNAIHLDERENYSFEEIIRDSGYVPVKSYVQVTVSSITLSETTIYDLGTVSSNKTISLPLEVDPAAEYEVRFLYSSGTITWPSGVAVANDATLTLTPGKLYHVIITGGVLYFSETTQQVQAKE